jgi:Phosphoesterase family
MLNDGHDTTIDYASNWTRSFLTPLLNNTAFNDNKTLIIITFDENETYTIKNNVWALLLGNAVPPSLRNQTDSTFYTHYSQLATVQANWKLYNLGRGDATPPNNNVFSFVAAAANWTNVNVTVAEAPYNNFTATGYKPNPPPELLLFCPPNTHPSGLADKKVL